MRPHWNRNHARNVEAANDRLRQRYEDRREDIGLNPVAIPDQLKRAICGPRWSGESVLVTADGRDVAAVLGTESTDAWAIWRDITAAVQADDDTGTGVRLIPPAPFAEGLRAVAVPSEQQVVVWRSSAESVTNRQRRIAARRALRALDRHKVPPAVLLSLLVPGWRKAVPIAAVATAAALVAVLMSSGQIWHLNRRPSSPTVAATRQTTAGAGHDLAPTASSSGPAGRRRSSRLAPGGDAPPRHDGTGTLPAGPASSPGRASATQPQPSPTRTSPSPSPHPTAKKRKCALSVLGICVSRK
jgi:hypothetical protein